MAAKIYIFVFPAHAGMFLLGLMLFRVLVGFPRARGDVPPSGLPKPDEK